MHCLASLLSMFPGARGDPSITAPTCVPQVTDMLQEVLTTIGSLKTTVEGFQEELHLLKDNFQKVCAQSWDSCWRALSRGVGLPGDLDGQHTCMG